MGFMKWIVFDAWGVIYSEPDDVANKLTPFVLPFLLKHNLALPRERIREAYIRASAGQTTAAQFWGEIGLGDRYPRIQEELLDSYLIFDEQFTSVALGLQKRYLLGLLSNDLSEWSAGLRQRYHIERFFQAVVISDEAGSRKPDRGIYETFLRRAGCAAGDCLFIDDRLRNLHGAAQLGMRTCWFDRTGVPDADFEAEARVTSFPELPNAIAKVWGCVPTGSNQDGK
jgi:FMN phosphatase YigB (HAD superfamily)